MAESNHQPFSVDDRYTLTFNGEIFNYLEIRKELQEQGIAFNTQGDTEVLLQSYIMWGEECVHKFNGMWAFAIHDKELNIIFCSRDRFGIKPFSYSYQNDEFIFSSEIKPILNYNSELRVPNFNMIANYCYKSLGAQSVQTWFQNIYRLLPGHNMTFKNGELKINRYWKYNTTVDKSLSFEEAKEQFDFHFTNAVRLRMRSDVEVGSTLTSGLDSSSIVGVIKELGFEGMQTFTAYSESNKFTKADKSFFRGNVDLDESKVVRKLNEDFGTNPNLISVSFSNYVDKLTDIIYYLESGHSSPATIAIHQVYKKAKKKIKVLMEGQGADELLAGYVGDIAPYHILELLKKGRFFSAYKEYKVFRKVYSVSYMFLLFLRSFDSKLLNSFKNLFSGIHIFNKGSFKFSYIKDNPDMSLGFGDGINRILHEQHTSGLVNLLHYGDALSMSQGIESRLPFMDYRLVDLAFKMPYYYKFDKMKGKLIQRESLRKYLPSYISESLLKIGFATPLDNIINTSEEIEEILVKYNYGSFFNNGSIERMLKSNRKGKKNFSKILFRILCAKIWFKIFIEKEGIVLKEKKNDESLRFQDL